MRAVMLAVVLVAASSTSAPAQSPANPIIDNYHAYVAALQRADLPGAETAAQAALTASQARDGEGGRTGVLALNLVQVQLLRGEAAQAAPAADLLLRIAQTRGDSGVNLLAARLVHGQTVLATRGAQGRDELEAGLREAEHNSDVEDYAYPASVALAQWALWDHQYPLAREAWAWAATHANGAFSDPELARAQARTGEAASLLLDQRAEDATPAWTMLLEVHDQLYSAAHRDTPDHAVSDVQWVYAQAQAWFAIANLRNTQVVPLDQIEDQSRVTLHEPDTNFCPMNWVRPQNDDLSRFYPREAIDRGIEGVVVARLVTDEGGAIVKADAIASAPDRMFERSASSLFSRGTLQRADHAPDGCVMPHVDFETVHFQIEGRHRRRH
ncbi:MAG: energy transducer TonB [Pseudomonadota bacterium]